ncbi:uncharacterized protein LOC120087160 isoform X2 [Benincasa hispida]|uniref:uncharacterized protein LOC120087160 isoform X2 n=1 Tax=Benincasa hispida TaxID=102211 RepID=UPI001901C0AA|nr:uncharacterized protein LOC120087160 isoform X2 [Benincasa hispida]
MLSAVPIDKARLRMIVCRSLFRVDRFLKYTSPYVLHQPGLYAYNGWSLNANMTNKKEFRSAADQKKKRKTISQAWKPVCTQASPSEDLSVKDDRVELEDGSRVQEMDCRMHTSTASARNVVEVAEEINVVTELSVESSAFPNMDGDANLEGQSVPSDEKFSVKLDVGSSLIRFVRGKGGSTQERIEEEMGVKIMIPSSKKEEFVVIEGNSVDSVTKASEKIQSIIDEAIKSPSLDYSHFVSLPLALHPELVEKLTNFQNSILRSSESCLDEAEDSDTNEDNTDNEVEVQHTVEAPDVAVELKVDDKREQIKVNINIPVVSYPSKTSKASTPSDLGIDKSIFIKPNTFHLTVLMLKLWNKDRVDAASEVLRGISSKIMDALDNRQVLIRLKGLDCMRGSLAKARVLYAPVEEIGNEGRLLRACLIINAFTEAGLVLEKDAKQKLKLHATVMNARHRKSKKKKKFDSFDAREIFKHYGSEEWGEYHIREVHLSQRFSFDENGYYHCCASIPFPDEHMQVD